MLIRPSEGSEKVSFNTRFMRAFDDILIACPKARRNRRLSGGGDLDWRCLSPQSRRL